MFKKAKEGWFSRDGKLYCCKLCNFKTNTRYRKGEKNVMGFARMEPYQITLWERIKELFQ